MNYSKIRKIIIPFLMMVFFIMSSSFAQVERTMPQENENEMYRMNSDRWTQSLNNRLNLTDDQQMRINAILTDFQTRRATSGAAGDVNTLQNDVNRQIEGVLDDNQRTNWDTYSTTWWNEINRGINTGTGVETPQERRINETETETDINRQNETEREGTDEGQQSDDDIR